MNRTKNKAVIFPAPKRSLFPVFLSLFKMYSSLLSTHIFLLLHPFPHQNLIITGMAVALISVVASIGRKCGSRTIYLQQKKSLKNLSRHSTNIATILTDTESCEKLGRVAPSYHGF